nr:uncharacterized protein LOC107440222 [Parasteatoda tepidariorum]
MNFIVKIFIFSLCTVCIYSSTPKYSTPVGKVQIQTSSTTVGKTAAPPSPTNVHKKYVDFDLKSQSSRYSNEDPFLYHYGHHHGHHGHHDHGHHKSYEHLYPYESYDYYGKDYGIGHFLPYVIGGIALLLLPMLSLLLTLAVNVAPGSAIPTAVTTATGKLLKSLNSTDALNEIWTTLDSAISKYGRRLLEDE